MCRVYLLGFTDGPRCLVYQTLICDFIINGSFKVQLLTVIPCCFFMIAISDSRFAIRCSWLIHGLHPCMIQSHPENDESRYSWESKGLFLYCSFWVACLGLGSWVGSLPLFCSGWSFFVVVTHLPKVSFMLFDSPAVGSEKILLVFSNFSSTRADSELRLEVNSASISSLLKGFLLRASSFSLNSSSQVSP